MIAALDHLPSHGMVIADADVQHLTPLLWGHITFHGSYHVDLGEPSRRVGVRLLRIQATRDAEGREMGDEAQQQDYCEKYR